MPASRKTLGVKLTVSIYTYLKLTDVSKLEFSTDAIRKGVVEGCNNNIKKKMLWRIACHPKFMNFFDASYIALQLNVTHSLTHFKLVLQSKNRRVFGCDVSLRCIIFN